MKRRREGTLHDPVYSSTDAHDYLEIVSHSLPAFADAEDFLAKATALAKRMQRDSLRGEYAAALMRHVAQVRRWVRSGVNPRAIDAAVSAALALAALCGEIRDDAKTKLIKSQRGAVTRGKITRAAYLAAKRKAGDKQAAIAKVLGVSETALKKWRRHNLG